MLKVHIIKKWKGFIKCQPFSNVIIEQKGKDYVGSSFERNKDKFKKNTKFKEDLYKYHHEEYIDCVNSRPSLYLKDEEIYEHDDNEDNVQTSHNNNKKKKKKNTYDKRLKRNIPFIYSNEIQNLEELKKNPFILVNVKNMKNESFGVATFNPYSLISARIISNNTLFSININFFIEKIKNSLHWRCKLMTNQEEQENDIRISSHHINNEKKNELINFHEEQNKINNSKKENNLFTYTYHALNPKHCYRLINAEGDNIPGLIIDRYDDFISIQHITLGCEMLAYNINHAILELLNPKAIIFRNDIKDRLNEKLEIYKKVVFGKVPEQVRLIENKCFFLIDLINSPNTGWFFNRKELRKLVCNYANQKQVLDLFSYVGSFGIQCSKIGNAKYVVCVEKDSYFVELAIKSANMNNLKYNVKMNSSQKHHTNKQNISNLENNNSIDNTNCNISFLCQDALEFLKNCKQLFDIIILDPPNLIPKSKFLESGTKRYIDLIHLAQKCVTPSGLILITFTTKLCSYQDYINIINMSFSETNKNVKIVGQGRGSPDHPIHLSLYVYADFYWFLIQLDY
ncbi:conserved Plasmodium protein, unknown function [Plasmodium sp. gorilla clade G2]|uniref:conserved Plasmodium protein, unknown function n=1 Tax=Plasmodium sp. gorilla clade G2 TaxID=880535 RepID=UPI000D226622|nr:conserved Plasmodium protein, unknown function [Plasmodium sp. gorilla clade G2]SOV17105.1 conserved Plasmodium protein, unknown function [Plasmodium sp. gorilla clade G2]